MPSAPPVRCRLAIAGPILALVTFWAGPGYACSRCVPLVHATALGPGFGETLSLLLLPVVLIGVVVAAVHGRPRPA